MNYSIRKCKGRNWGLARHTGCGLGDWALWEILTGFRSSNLQDFFCLRSGDAIPHNLLGPLTSPASLGWSWLGSPEIAPPRIRGADSPTRSSRLRWVYPFVAGVVFGSVIGLILSRQPKTIA